MERLKVTQKRDFNLSLAKFHKDQSISSEEDRDKFAINYVEHHAELSGRHEDELSSIKEEIEDLEYEIKFLNGLNEEMENLDISEYIDSETDK